MGQEILEGIMAVIHDQRLLNLIQHLHNGGVEGDYMEVGVYVGETFHRLCKLAEQTDKKCFALDSFCGMDEPGEYDGLEYPKGRLSNGGVDAFKELMTRAGCKEETYECFEGYIPDCFRDFDEAYPNHKLSFALVDVDHYMPTLETVRWIWPKISKHGILVLDDYFRGKDELASKAIESWIPELHFTDWKFQGLVDTQIYMEKLV
jgi:hypothetical protein